MLKRIIKIFTVLLFFLIMLVTTGFALVVLWFFVYTGTGMMVDSIIDNVSRYGKKDYVFIASWCILFLPVYVSFVMKLLDKVTEKLGKVRTYVSKQFDGQRNIADETSSDVQRQEDDESPADKGSSNG